LPQKPAKYEALESAGYPAFSMEDQSGSPIMQINPYIFILPCTPNQIVWDYKNHKQFELNLDYSTRLAHLIEDPEKFDTNNIIDIQFLSSEILTASTQDTIEWGWDELSKIFHIGTKNTPCEYVPQDINEWSRHYLDHCADVLATPAPGTRLTERPTSEWISLPQPSRLPRLRVRDHNRQGIA
jgi:hypothetical protein